MVDSIHYPPTQQIRSGHTCAICGFKSVGMNFGVFTCSPCKGRFAFLLLKTLFDSFNLAFFRRNARRKEVKLIENLFV